MTPKDALNQHVSKDLTDRWAQPVLDAVLAAIEDYHQQQVNSVDLADVVQQRELLIAFLNEFKSYCDLDVTPTIDDVDKCLRNL